MGAITVFGGTGFIGKCIVRALASRGLHVRVTARLPTITGFAGVEEYTEYVRADVRDEAAVDRAVRGAAAVVNAVSLYFEHDGLTFEAIHVEGAARVAQAAQAAGVPTLVHLSGIGADASSASPYVSARGRGEARVRERAPYATILRPSVVFGPGSGFLATLDRLTRLPVIPLFGQGSTRLQPVHVDDVARAVRQVIEDSSLGGRTYELGGAQAYTYREILALVLAYRHRSRPMLPVPFALWQRLAYVSSLLPRPPLTPDQVELMVHDNVVSADAATFDALGIKPQSLESAFRHQSG